MSAVKIVATLGSSSSSPEQVERLLRVGVDAVRLNFSYGSHRDHANLVHLVRKTAQRLGKHITVLQDLQGPRIRTGPLKDGGPLGLEQESEITIAHDLVEGNNGRISSTYPDIYRFLSPGDRVLFDDGRLEARVLAVQGRDIRCQVVKGGLLGAFQGINLPDIALDIPTFTAKDREDLEFGLKIGVDWVAMSFVKSGQDADLLRSMMRRQRTGVPLVAKVERAAALLDLEGILNAFDGVMVARGDLGVELSPEEVPVWQKTIVRQARRKGKIAIVATQMLESMISEPRPTRAEASDVANAVCDGADAVMLSGETAIGSFPVEAVAVMARIIQTSQEIYVPEELPATDRYRREAQAVARAACALADDLNAQAIAVLTRSGVTAHRISRCRPAMPIFALTQQPRLARRLNMWWGVVPVLTDLPDVTVDSHGVIEKILLEKELVKRGEKVVAVGSSPLAARVPTNFLKVLRIGAHAYR
ncbi:MAG: pyruvate kinase [Actinomycetia bacterium]|nr:pyruvate kinase [Actinomycetes bacterium]